MNGKTRSVDTVAPSQKVHDDFGTVGPCKTHGHTRYSLGLPVVADAHESGTNRFEIGILILVLAECCSVCGALAVSVAQVYVHFIFFCHS